MFIRVFGGHLELSASHVVLTAGDAFYHSSVGFRSLPFTFGS